MSKTTPEDLAKKRSDEKMLVSEMIALYCRKQHHTLRGSLCPECQQLHDYALARIEHFPFMERTGCTGSILGPAQRMTVRIFSRISG